VKFPRDLSGEGLAKALAKRGYRVTRQTGSHMRLTTPSPTEHHLTIPNHKSLRIGTLAAILNQVAAHLKISREELLQELFEK
jgi:predicted RNA binding protein YcfA (HicA-like mRNA interferase family)